MKISHSDSMEPEVRGRLEKAIASAEEFCDKHVAWRNVSEGVQTDYCAVDQGSHILVSVARRTDEHSVPLNSLVLSVDVSGTVIFNVSFLS